MKKLYAILVAFFIISAVNADASTNVPVLGKEVFIKVDGKYLAVDPADSRNALKGMDDNKTASKFIFEGDSRYVVQGQPSKRFIVCYVSPDKNTDNNRYMVALNAPGLKASDATTSTEEKSRICCLVKQTVAQTKDLALFEYEQPTAGDGFYIKSAAPANYMGYLIYDKEIGVVRGYDKDRNTPDTVIKQTYSYTKKITDPVSRFSTEEVVVPAPAPVAVVAPVATSAAPVIPPVQFADGDVIILRSDAGVMIVDANGNINVATDSSAADVRAQVLMTASNGAFMLKMGNNYLVDNGNSLKSSGSGVALSLVVQQVDGTSKFVLKRISDNTFLTVNAGGAAMTAAGTQFEKVLARSDLNFLVFGNAAKLADNLSALSVLIEAKKADSLLMADLVPVIIRWARSVFSLTEWTTTDVKVSARVTKKARDYFFSILDSILTTYPTDDKDPARAAIGTSIDGLYSFLSDANAVINEQVNQLDVLADAYKGASTALMAGKASIWLGALNALVAKITPPDTYLRYRLDDHVRKYLDINTRTDVALAQQANALWDIETTLNTFSLTTKDMFNAHLARVIGNIFTRDNKNASFTAAVARRIINRDVDIFIQALTNDITGLSDDDKTSMQGHLRDDLLTPLGDVIPASLAKDYQAALDRVSVLKTKAAAAAVTTPAATTTMPVVAAPVVPAAAAVKDVFNRNVANVTPQAQQTNASSGLVNRSSFFK